MSNPSEFFVELPSNSNLEDFPRNNIGDYTVRLPSPIDLSQYTVCMSAIQFPSVWKNVTEDCSLVVHHGSTNIPISLPEGRYKNIQMLLESLEESLTDKGLNGWIQISWNSISLKCAVVINRNDYKLTLSTKLANMLGFHSVTHFQHGVNLSEACADIDEGMTSLFVYSPIVVNQYVGDTLAPLLRVVPLQSANTGDVVSVEFRHPRYLTTINDKTDLISIRIRRDDGSIVPFMTGKVNVTLRFKRIS